MATLYTTRGLPVLPWPAQIRPAEITAHLQFNTTAFTSPYTRTVQTIELPGALFQLDAAFPPIDGTQLGDFRAFIARLRGGAGRFYFPAHCCTYSPPAQYQPERVTIIPLTADRTTITADTTQITADATQVQYESVFTVSSCPDAVTIVGTLWLNSNERPVAPGGYISWDDATGWRHLHLIVAVDAAPYTLGVHLTVEPPMRALPTPATPMHVHAPSGIYRLVDDGQGAIRQAAGKGTFSISAVEARPLEIVA